MSREEQMMNAADRYADEVCDESCTGAQVAETINDFCAGWRAADQHPQWIPVEERLPEMYERVLVAGLDKRSKLKEPLLFVTCRAKEECGIKCDSNGFSVGDIPFAYKKVTHWMPIVPPRKEENNESETTA